MRGSDPQLSNITGTKPILHQLNAPDVIKCNRKGANLMPKFPLTFPLAGSQPEHSPTSRHATTAITLLLACSINSRGAFPNWNAAPNQGIQLLMQGGELGFLSWNKTALTIRSPRTAAKRKARAILPLRCLPQRRLRLTQHPARLCWPGLPKSMNTASSISPASWSLPRRQAVKAPSSPGDKPLFWKKQSQSSSALGWVPTPLLAKLRCCCDKSLNFAPAAGRLPTQPGTQPGTPWQSSASLSSVKKIIFWQYQDYKAERLWFADI